jgi:hypothetical protein
MEKHFFNSLITLDSFYAGRYFVHFAVVTK